MESPIDEAPEKRIQLVQLTMGGEKATHEVPRPSERTLQVEAFAAASLADNKRKLAAHEKGGFSPIRVDDGVLFFAARSQRVPGGRPQTTGRQLEGSTDEGDERQAYFCCERCQWETEVIPYCDDGCMLHVCEECTAMCGYCGQSHCLDCFDDHECQ